MEYTDLRNGTAFIYEGAPYVVVSSEFHRMQMRKAIMRCVIRNLKTGQQLQKTFTASDRFDSAPVMQVAASYLYCDEDFYYFMEKETYEQHQVTKEVVGEKAAYLTEEMVVEIMLYDGDPIQIKLPTKVTLKVVEAPNAIRGDSVTNNFKMVTCEGGVRVSCPIFVKEGDVIRINTETDEY
ncbi:MAG TPA: elongation factor P, partial [Spirochaetota bacterium]